MKKKLLVPLLCLAVAFVFAACGGGDPVATVNGVEISRETYDDYLTYTMSSYGLGGDYEMSSSMAEMLQTQTIESLVYMEEMKQACEKADCMPSEDEIEEALWTALGATDEATYKQAMVSVCQSYNISEDTVEMIVLSGLYSEKLADYVAEEKGLKVSNKEVQTAYDEDPESYDNRTVSHILIIPEVAEGREAETDESGNTVYTDEEWAAAKEKAEDLIAQLNDGADFAELAKENSDDSTAADGGALGESFTKANTPYVEEFTEASFELKAVDEFTQEPVKSSYGYHIILCTGIQDADNDFDGLKDAIKESLLSEQKQTALTEYMEEFKEACDVVIYYGANATSAEAEEEVVEEESAEEEAASGDDTTDADASKDAAADDSAAEEEANSEE